MLTTIVISVITSAISGSIAFAIQRQRLRAELRTEFMAEQAVRSLLETDRWKKRTFTEIQRRIGGFSDDELRKILVRSGAVRFGGSDGTELWGLISRNREEV